MSRADEVIALLSRASALLTEVVEKDRDISVVKSNAEKQMLSCLRAALNYDADVNIDVYDLLSEVRALRAQARVNKPLKDRLCFLDRLSTFFQVFGNKEDVMVRIAGQVGPSNLRNLMERFESAFREAYGTPPEDWPGEWLEKARKNDT